MNEKTFDKSLGGRDGEQVRVVCVAEMKSEKTSKEGHREREKKKKTQIRAHRRTAAKRHAGSTSLARACGGRPDPPDRRPGNISCCPLPPPQPCTEGGRDGELSRWRTKQPAGSQPLGLAASELGERNDTHRKARCRTTWPA